MTGQVFFLGSKPVLQNTVKGTALFWRWRLADHRIKIGAASGKSAAPVEQAAALAALLEQVSYRSAHTAPGFYAELVRILGDGPAEGAWKVLRNGGLVVV
jgi:hypothetical protein